MLLILKILTGLMESWTSNHPRSSQSFVITRMFGVQSAGYSLFWMDNSKKSEAASVENGALNDSCYSCFLMILLFVFWLNLVSIAAHPSFRCTGRWLPSHCGREGCPPWLCLQENDPVHQREEVIWHGLASQAQTAVLFGASLPHQDFEDLGYSNICISAAGVNLFWINLHQI